MKKNEDFFCSDEFSGISDVALEAQHEVFDSHQADTADDRIEQDCFDGNVKVSKTADINVMSAYLADIKSAPC